MRKNQLLFVAGITAIVFGIGALGIGVFGISYTYNRAADEKITTPEDASIPEAPVRGPFTMLSQANVIREHTYSSTGGLAYAEMPQKTQATDDDGNLLVNEDGSPFMIPNGARNIWVTSTTLQTALQLGALAYALSAFAMLYGFTSTVTGLVFLKLRDSKSTPGAM